MGSPAEHIARLDRSLDRNGEDIVLRRVVGTTNQAVVDVTLRTIAIPQGADQVASGGMIAQERFKLILSPTEIDRAQWPGGMKPDFVGDPRHPLVGYKAVVRSKERQIEAVMPLVRNNELVRLELMVMG